MDEKRIYKTLEEFSNDQIRDILYRNVIDELITLPLSVGESGSMHRIYVPGYLNTRIH